MDRETAERLRKQPGEDDWTHMRRVALSGERAPEWPAEVRGISMNGLSLLGIHEKSRELYWDGKPIAMKPPVRLGTYERWIAFFAMAGTFGNFLVQAGRSVGWWH